MEKDKKRYNPYEKYIEDILVQNTSYKRKTYSFFS